MVPHPPSSQPRTDSVMAMTPTANDDEHQDAAERELLQDAVVWHSESQHHLPTSFTPSPSPSPSPTRPDQNVPANAVLSLPPRSSVIHVSLPNCDPHPETQDQDSHSDSDFDFLPESVIAEGTSDGAYDFRSQLGSQPHRQRQQIPEDSRRVSVGSAIEPGWASASVMEAGSSNDFDNPDWPQAGENADAQDLAGPGVHGRLECGVSSPQKEGEGTPNPYVSYLVTTDTDFKSYQSLHSTVRRRFTDFVFLYRTLAKEYPQCAVPPLPDKHNMSYVRGDRFSSEFTARRASSLRRFLKRLTLHPVLRRATVLTLFLESNDWHGVMKTRPNRGMSGSESGGGSVLESWTDSFLNAFTKPHKTDKRFQDVNDRASKLDDDLGTVSKTVARVAKREGDLEADYADLAIQFQKLAALEPGVQDELTKYATSVQSTGEGWKHLKDHTDQDYLASLKDMEAYITSVRALLKTREQKQLDFEGLTDYLNKAAQERDTLASSAHSGSTSSGGASGFLRQKIEDVRGIDHELSRRERLRKLEVQISRLTTEVEAAKKTTEAFDEEVVKEIADFERIKAVEFRDTLGGLADANIGFFQRNIETWERFVRDLEGLQAEVSANAAAGV